MYYLSPGPVLWVTPLSASAIPVPLTESYYTVPLQYAPPAAPVVPLAYGPPIAYGMPVAYGAPVVFWPSYYSYVPSISPPRGEYRIGRCLCICL